MSGAPAPTVYEQLAGAVRAARPVALVTVVEGPQLGAKLLVLGDTGEVVGTLGGQPELDHRAVWEARGLLARGGTRLVEGCEANTVFVEAFVAPPQMVIFGAIDFTAALVKVAKVLGFRVTVCDARAVFATAQRFPEADEVVVDWPDRLLARVGPQLGPRDAVCVLTHDAKFDGPAIVSALATDVGYIGALGSRRTHAERVIRLKDAGVDDGALDRLRSPIGLDIGARTPEETAVAICAEIVSDQTGTGTAVRLTDTDGPIHRRSS